MQTRLEKEISYLWLMSYAMSPSKALILLFDKEAPVRHSKTSYHEFAMPTVRPRHLGLAPICGRIYTTTLTAWTRLDANQNQNKNAGGQPPALEGPPIRSIHLLYTTNRNVNSILPKIEHMFYTNNTNICSPYRKAA